ncbi:MAG: ABC transporter ATP-binding protein, partial [Chloroflexus sp.]|nr:ABC transporter ATP-binding protein [Chloroflexus sp.]
MTTPVLTVNNLTVAYRVGQRELAVVREVSLAVHEGEILGIVGESGSGKSTLGLAILQALPSTGRICAGQVFLDGVELTGLSGSARRALWANSLRLVPQNPLAALNPTMRIGEQLIEAIGGDRPTATAQAINVLKRVHIPDPARVMRSYPHELSGGMQQRVMIA